jgi:hypothetical protein
MYFSNNHQDEKFKVRIKGSWLNDHFYTLIYKSEGFHSNIYNTYGARNPKTNLHNFMKDHNRNQSCFFVLSSHEIFFFSS